MITASVDGQFEKNNGIALPGRPVLTNAKHLYSVQLTFNSILTRIPSSREQQKPVYWVSHRQKRNKHQISMADKMGEINSENMLNSQ